MEEREVQISEVLYGSKEVSAIRKPLSGYLYNNFRVYNRSTAGTTTYQPPSWAYYAHVVLVGGGGGGGAGSGTLPIRGEGGRNGVVYQTGFFLDGLFAGSRLQITVGAGGQGGNGSSANGSNGGETTALWVDRGSTYRAAGGFGGSGGTTGHGGDGLRTSLTNDDVVRLRANLSSTITWPSGVPGVYRDSTAGTNATGSGHGGGGGGGGIFNQWRRGGDGSSGYARVVFWGMDPYVDPNENPYMN